MVIHQRQIDNNLVGIKVTKIPTVINLVRSKEQTQSFQIVINPKEIGNEPSLEYIVCYQSQGDR